ncbi:hypothetical protein EDD18DRAFT_542082 [Armillaria luteobubalina]|uniref:DUF6534 domain-containing protein n=1 Tax=Armillaria luteobubalina TaxID=153913 RepID=A0AA39TBS3_9AGAR|nr:hypothetical protein EDD18DRAFT_873328 [Armillaria luteobubalina]KAK0491835.1 hypothetical protein EDD18DRAFT_542082 [Armillaria luteobubalina]
MSTDISSTMGAIYIGATVATAFWGITAMQSMTYFSRFPNDWWFYRFAVGLLWIVDTLYLIFCAHALYYYLIKNFANPQALTTIVWSFKTDIMFLGLLILLVDIVYAVRIWMLGRFFHKTVPWLIAVVIAGTTAVVINEIHAIFTIKTYQDSVKVSKSIEALLGTTAGVDILICGAMSYYLLKSRSISNFSRSSKPLLVLSRFVVVSGLATTICALTILITFVGIPGSLVATGIATPLPRVYLNSLLAMLNMRNSHQENIVISSSGGGGSLPSTVLASMRFKSRNTAATDIQSQEQDISVPMADLRTSRSSVEPTTIPDVKPRALDSPC